MTDPNLTPEQIAEINKQLFMSPEAKEEAQAATQVEESGHAQELAAYEEATVIPVVKLDLRRIPLPVFAELEGYFYRVYLPCMRAFSTFMQEGGLTTKADFKSPTELNLGFMSILYSHNGERGIDLPDEDTLNLEDIDFIGTLIADTFKNRAATGGGITKK